MNSIYILPLNQLEIKVFFQYVRVIKIDFFQGLGQFFKKLYFQHLKGPQDNTQVSGFLVTTFRLVSACCTM